MGFYIELLFHSIQTQKDFFYKYGFNLQKGNDYSGFFNTILPSQSPNDCPILWNSKFDIHPEITMSHKELTTEPIFLNTETLPNNILTAFHNQFGTINILN